MSTTTTVTGVGNYTLQATTLTLRWAVTAVPAVVGRQTGAGIDRLFGAGWITLVENGLGVAEFRSVDFAERVFERPSGHSGFGVFSLEHYLPPGASVDITEYP